MNTHISTIKQLEQEIETRSKRLRDLQREKEANELATSEELNKLRMELDDKNDRIS
jgi:uncharacterized protein YlxW (UPF0749 family)